MRRSRVRCYNALSAVSAEGGVSPASAVIVTPEFIKIQIRSDLTDTRQTSLRWRRK